MFEVSFELPGVEWLQYLPSYAILAVVALFGLFFLVLLVRSLRRDLGDIVSIYVPSYAPDAPSYVPPTDAELSARPAARPLFVPIAGVLDGGAPLPMIALVAERAERPTVRQQIAGESDKDTDDQGDDEAVTVPVVPVVPVVPARPARPLPALWRVAGVGSLLEQRCVPPTSRDDLN